MIDTVILHAGATPSAPELVRPCSMEDVAALVEVFQGPALRHWTALWRLSPAGPLMP
ncbi:hypothetical protein ABT270_07010 [Streptomyces sp900105245]|uniref:hypothetical protein n=1 Tax=Streptomyces sp. 900105245 TaxID=3154379 RepID=UPI0033337B8A